MATAISNFATSSANAASAANPVSSAAVGKSSTPSVQPPSTLKDDTVKLSLAANIKLMHHQGLSPSIIASRLGVSVKQVDTYIPGAAQATSAAATVAAEANQSTTTAKSTTTSPTATPAK